MPKGDNKILKYYYAETSMESPVAIYSDLESAL